MRLKIRPRTRVYIESPSGGELFAIDLQAGDGPAIRYEYRLPHPLRTTLAKALLPLTDRINNDEFAGKSSCRAHAEKDHLLVWSTDSRARVNVRAHSDILRFEIIVDDQEDPDEDQIDASLLAAPSHRPLVTAF